LINCIVRGASKTGSASLCPAARPPALMRCPGKNIGAASLARPTRSAAEPIERNSALARIAQNGLPRKAPGKCFAFDPSRPPGPEFPSLALVLQSRGHSIGFGSFASMSTTSVHFAQARSGSRGRLPADLVRFRCAVYSAWCLGLVLPEIVADPYPPAAPEHTLWYFGGGGRKAHDPRRLLRFGQAACA